MKKTWSKKFIPSYAILRITHTDFSNAMEWLRSLEFGCSVLKCIEDRSLVFLTFAKFIAFPKARLDREFQAQKNVIPHNNGNLNLLR